MRAGYCAAALSLTFACASAQESHTPQTLAILYHFEQPHAERALKETERELKNLIGDETVKLEWHDRGDFEGRSTFSTIVILNFQGACDPQSDSSYDGPMDSWLARMHVIEGVVQPFGDVNCDLVRALMSGGPHSAKLTDQEFGHGLARVLAHELYHFLTQSTEHARQGLEKPSFSHQDLVSESLRLDRQELVQLSRPMSLQ
jgi:hypothetical protein